jgi:hypothetical protein
VWPWAQGPGCHFVSLFEALCARGARSGAAARCRRRCSVTIFDSAVSSRRVACVAAVVLVVHYVSYAMVLVDEKPPLTPAPGATAGDEPPPYTLPPNTAVPRVRPVNFLSSARSGDGVARGEFVVDPLLVLPPALLPPSPAGEERDNLRLETRDGAIDADVWVIPGASTAFRGVIATPVEQEKTTARLNFKSQRGPMSLRLVSCSRLSDVVS